MSNAVKTGLVAALRADTTLMGYLHGGTTSGTASVYHAVIAQGGTLPAIVYQKVPGTGPAYTFGAKAWENELYNIKAVTEGSSAVTAGSISERIDAVLTDAVITVAGGTCLYLRRESDIDYPEVSDGKTYFHTGGLYRVWSA